MRLFEVLNSIKTNFYILYVEIKYFRSKSIKFDQPETGFDPSGDKTKFTLLKPPQCYTETVCQIRFESVHKCVLYTGFDPGSWPFGWYIDLSNLPQWYSELSFISNLIWISQFMLPLYMFCPIGKGFCPRVFIIRVIRKLALLKPTQWFFEGWRQIWF
jgi:hypothetical protein